MFGEYQYELAERILDIFDLEEVIEMNQLEPDDVLECLIRNGLISEPERIIQDYEDSQRVDEDGLSE